MVDGVEGVREDDGPALDDDVEEGRNTARDSNSSIRVLAIQVFFSADSGPPHSSLTAMVSAGHRSRMASTARANSRI